MERSPKVLDLFCGAGGMSTGFERAGYNVVAGVDKYEEATNSWEANHSGDVISGDLTEMSSEEILDEVGDIDVVVGGPPCKDFSKTNQKVDLGRNNLVILYAKIVSEINPEVFVMENVRQITTKYDDVLDEMYNTLNEDYSISHRLLDSADYGVPQHRIRAFIIGIRDYDENPKFPSPTHGPDSSSGKELVSAGEALKDIEKPDRPEEYKSNSKHAHLLDNIPPGMNYSFYTEKLGHPDPKFEWRSRFSDYLYKADPEKPVRTLKAKPGAASGPFHWNNRRFTEDEMKRLQSFPDNYKFATDSYTHITRLIGNSVPPAQAHAIGRAVYKQADFNVHLMGENGNLDFHSRRRTSTEEYKKKAEKRIDELYSDDS